MNIRNPVVWVITFVSVLSPFVIDFLLRLLIHEIRDRVLYYFLLALVIPIVWITCWRIYVEGMKGSE